MVVHRALDCNRIKSTRYEKHAWQKDESKQQRWKCVHMFAVHASPELRSSHLSVLLELVDHIMDKSQSLLWVMRSHPLYVKEELARLPLWNELVEVLSLSLEQSFRDEIFTCRVRCIHLGGANW